MGIVSELEFDGDCCNCCGHQLHGNVGNIISRQVLTESDGELFIMLLKDVECGQCGKVTKVEYMGEPVSARFEVLAENIIAAVPAILECSRDLL